MSEEILNALANTNHVPVIARTSSFQFKGQTRDVKEIGRLLGVTHVLEGSVRKADKEIRLTAQLIDASTGAHVWSEVYQRQMSDIFELQNEITKDIVDQIGVVLDGEMAPLPTAQVTTARRTANLEAYDLYLKGVQMLSSTNPADTEQAAGYFDQAIALDAEYADAWAGKVQALRVLAIPGTGHSHIPASVYPDAIVAFRRALEIEPGHALATGWLGATLMANDYKWAEGMRLIKQSLTQNPNDAQLQALYAMCLNMMQIEGADEALDKACHLNPFDKFAIVIRAKQLIDDDRLLEAASLVETGLIDDREGYAPNFHDALFNKTARRFDAA
jgi:adenylate cyclase